MKAFILAAGMGSRLRPLTDRIPKCLVPIQGRPILEIWLKKLADVGVTEVLINTHYLAGQVEKFVVKYEGPLRIHLTYESVLLGSAGTIAKNSDFFDNGDDFFIIYADNLTKASLRLLWDFHCAHDGVATLGLFHSDSPSQCGIVSLNSEQKILEFVEKPNNPRSDLANAGVMVASAELFKYIPDKLVPDLGFDVLPQLIGKMYGHVLEEPLIDIGTIERYKKAQLLWGK